MNVTKHPDGIELKPSELIIAIADCIRANRVPITLSHPGAGKSDMYKHVIEEVLRMRMVDPPNALESA